METKATSTSQNVQATDEQEQVVEAPASQDAGAMVQESKTPEEQAADARRAKIAIIGGVVLVLVLLIAMIVLLASFPGATQVVRDIAIIFVAIETFLIGMAALVLVVQIEELIRVLRDEIQPLLRSVNETASTVRGTTEFVSHNMVSPIIKAAGFTAGLTASLRRVANDLRVVAQAARSGTKSTQANQGGIDDD